MHKYNYKEILYPDGTKQVVVYDVPITIHDDYDYLEESDIENQRPQYERMFAPDGAEVQVDVNTGVVRSDESIEHSENVSINRTINKIYDYAHCNQWEYFITLTFNPDMTDSYDYDACYKRVKSWIDNLRKRCPDMYYLFVPEKHKSGRFHFHGLISGADLRLVASDVENVYNIGSYKWGYTTSSIVRDSCASATYITKYISKELCNDTLYKHRYIYSKNYLRLAFPKNIFYLIN